MSQINRNTIASFLPILSILLAVTLLGACNSDDENSGISARIVEFFLDDNTINVGESTVLRSRFTFSANRVFDDGEHVMLVIRLPIEVAFRTGSAELQRPIDDRSVGAQITDCPETGEQFLLFNLDDNDLRTVGNPEGEADAELALTIDAVTPAQAAIIQGVAQNNTVIFSCGEPFISDRDLAIQIR